VSAQDENPLAQADHPGDVAEVDRLDRTHTRPSRGHSNAALNVFGTLRASFGRYPSEWMLGIAFALLFLAWCVFAPYFLTIQNLMSVIEQAAPIGIMAVGETFVILEAGIDLSVGRAYGLSGVVGALLMVKYGIFVGVIGTLAAGSLFGLVNGVLISYLNLPAFMVTLATLAIGGSLEQVVSGSQSVTGIPASFGDLGTSGFGPIPYYVVLTVIVFVIGHVIAHYTKTGRFIYAIGNNAEAARLAGINIRRYRLLPYVVTGFLCGVAVLISTSFLLSIDPMAGEGLELQVIAAVVIGGVTLMGGRGTIIGTAIGTFFVAILANGLNLLNVSPHWQGTAIGSVIVFAIILEPGYLLLRNFVQSRKTGGSGTQEGK